MSIRRSSSRAGRPFCPDNSISMDSCLHSTSSAPADVPGKTDESHLITARSQEVESASPPDLSTPDLGPSCGSDTAPLSTAVHPLEETAVTPRFVYVVRGEMDTVSAKSAPPDKSSCDLPGNQHHPVASALVGPNATNTPPWSVGPVQSTTTTVPSVPNTPPVLRRAPLQRIPQRNKMYLFMERRWGKIREEAHRTRR